MKHPLLWLLALAASLGLASLRADPTEQHNERRESPAFKKIEDTPGLPRVLLIGDSISIGYTAAVREALAGRANVHRAPVNCGPSSNGVKHISKWLGDGRWDVIHVNFGLHDTRLHEGGRLETTPENYEANLRVIIARLKATPARIIWATTTPVPAKAKEGQFPRRQSDIDQFNAIAVRLMTEAGIGINDLHALVLPDIARLQRPDDVHFHPRGYALLAEKVAAAIATELLAAKPAATTP